MSDKPENPKNDTPDWELMIEESQDIYFLKHEVKRLMRVNDALEFRANLAYAFGYGDSEGGVGFDSGFLIEDIHINQDDVSIWTAQENDQPPESDSDE